MHHHDPTPAPICPGDGFLSKESARVVMHIRRSEHGGHWAIVPCLTHDHYHVTRSSRGKDRRRRAIGKQRARAERAAQ